MTENAAVAVSTVEATFVVVAVVVDTATDVAAIVATVVPAAGVATTKLAHAVHWTLQVDSQLFIVVATASHDSRGLKHANASARIFLKIENREIDRSAVVIGDR